MFQIIAVLDCCKLTWSFYGTILLDIECTALIDLLAYRGVEHDTKKYLCLFRTLS